MSSYDKVKFILDMRKTNKLVYKNRTFYIDEEKTIFIEKMVNPTKVQILRLFPNGNSIISYLHL